MPLSAGDVLRHAKSMRREMTAAEARLWYHLRGGRFVGVKFKRQVVIGPYIADFAAIARKLVIEVDGDSHAGNEARDEHRTAMIEERGFRVIRFDNSDVMTNLDRVLVIIGQALGATPLPGPLPTGKREQQA